MQVSTSVTDAPRHDVLAIHDVLAPPAIPFAGAGSITCAQIERRRDVRRRSRVHMPRHVALIALDSQVVCELVLELEARVVAPNRLGDLLCSIEDRGRVSARLDGQVRPHVDLIARGGPHLWGRGEAPW